MIKRALYSWPALLVLSVATFFLAKGAVGIMTIERSNAARVKSLEQKTLELSLKEDEFKKSIAKLGSEEGILEEIKKKFSATREGEYIAVIVDERTKATSSEESASWYRKLWDAIRN